MELTKKEKRNVFLALLETYPNFERQRRLVKNFQSKGVVKSGDSFADILKSINKEEKAAYKLLKRFADSLQKKIPEYKEPD